MLGLAFAILNVLSDRVALNKLSFLTSATVLDRIISKSFLGLTQRWTNFRHLG